MLHQVHNLSDGYIKDITIRNLIIFGKYMFSQCVLNVDNLFFTIKNMHYLVQL